MAISNLESAASLFVGQGDLVIFNEVTDYSAATIATLAEPKSLGQVVEDSSNWTGDDVTVNEIKDEQGDLITATVSAGTIAFECELASTSAAMIKLFLNGVTSADGLTGVSKMSSIFGTGSKAGITEAVGFGTELPVIVRPIAWLNDEKKRLFLLPKAKITANIVNSDKLMRIHLNVLGEYLDTASLKTAMVLTAGKAAV